MIQRVFKWLRTRLGARRIAAEDPDRVLVRRGTPAKRGMILIRLQSLFGSSANVMSTIGVLAPTPARAASSREGGSGHFATARTLTGCTGGHEPLGVRCLRSPAASGYNGPNRFDQSKWPCAP
jgi:hypothetical protein